MIALTYHDVVSEGTEGSSGFPGVDAARYKITPERFRAHLAALLRAAWLRACALPVAMTFDDGGSSGMWAGDELERHGLRGYFFITTNYIGSSGFLTADQIRQLAARGHVIGSHSRSHPLRMGHASRSRILEEWSTSRDVLAQIIGRAVTIGSVPGGDFSRAVALAAAEAGYTYLLTSEPTQDTWRLGSIAVSGRFTVHRWTSAATVCAAARGAWAPWSSQALVWSLKKIGKCLGGEGYLRARKLLLRHGNEVRWGDQP